MLANEELDVWGYAAQLHSPLSEVEHLLKYLAMFVSGSTRTTCLAFCTYFNELVIFFLFSIREKPDFLEF